MDTEPEDLLFWGGLALIGLAYEYWALRTAHSSRTLSHFTRRVFHTHTKPGRLVFTLGWGGLAAWFAHHILTNTIEGNNS